MKFTLAKENEVCNGVIAGKTLFEHIDFFKFSSVRQLKLPSILVWDISGCHNKQQVTLLISIKQVLSY